MKIYISTEHDTVPINRPRLRKILRRIARAENFTGDISIAIVDDHTISALNAQFLGKNHPTDVLAFSYDPDPDGLAGEIVVSFETAERLASRLGEPFERELLRYCVHGLMHLCGYDDHNSSDRNVMEAKQESALGDKKEF